MINGADIAIGEPAPERDDNEGLAQRLRDARSYGARQLVRKSSALKKEKPF